MTVGKRLKQLRGAISQHSYVEQLQLPISRESLSKYENDAVQLPKDIARQISKRTGDMHFAIGIRHEYTGLGALVLNGPNSDLHRSALKEKTLEELDEAITALKSFCMTVPLSRIGAYEKEDLKKVLHELIDVPTAIENLLAVVTKEAGFDVTELYEEHYSKLEERQYVERRDGKWI